METSSNTAADKLLQTLLAFEVRLEWRLGDLATHLNLPKSTVHRLLSKLKDYQLVEQELTSNTYSLGLGAWNLARRARPYGALQRLARPYLERLAKSTRETAFLTVPEGEYSLCIDRCEGPQNLRLSMEVGTQAPLHQGASNLILLAHLPTQERERVVAHWRKQTAERAMLGGSLAKARQQGFAYTVAQLTPGVAALAVPVVQKEKRILAGLSIGGYSQRFTESAAMSILPELQKARDELEGVLKVNLAAPEEMVA